MPFSDSKTCRHLDYKIPIMVIWTHMIDCDLSAVSRPSADVCPQTAICGQTSAEVKSYNDIYNTAAVVKLYCTMFHLKKYIPKKIFG